MSAPMGAWQPAARPAWLEQFNLLALTTGAPDALVALDGPSLVAAATAATGLDDFGEDTWQEGFDLLLADLEGTANLNLMGRVLVRLEIIRSLIARLHLADAYRRRPEIEEEQIREPVFITGMGRSGTTVLHELLALDPAFRAPLTWELLHPGLAEVGGELAVEHRVAQTDVEHTFWNEVTPEFRTMHENRADAPNECGEGLLHDFRSTTWGGEHDVPNYDLWLALGDQAPVFRFHRRLLKLLQHGHGGRWLLKDPMHLARLPALFAEYPDAHVIITHRDPMKVLPSVASLMSTLRWQRSDTVDHDGIVRLLVGSYPFLLNKLVEDRASGAVPEDRVLDVRYAALMSDPIGTLAGVYGQLGLGFTDECEARATRYLAERPKDRHGAHDYAFADLGLSRDDTARAFQPYRDRYGIPSET